MWPFAARMASPTAFRDPACFGFSSSRKCVTCALWADSPGTQVTIGADKNRQKPSIPHPDYESGGQGSESLPVRQQRHATGKSSSPFSHRTCRVASNQRASRPTAPRGAYRLDTVYLPVFSRVRGFFDPFLKRTTGHKGMVDCVHVIVILAPAERCPIRRHLRPDPPPGGTTETPRSRRNLNRAPKARNATLCVLRVSVLNSTYSFRPSVAFAWMARSRGP
jgi:hypothetical protein